MMDGQKIRIACGLGVLYVLLQVSLSAAERHGREGNFGAACVFFAVAVVQAAALALWVVFPRRTTNEQENE